MILLTDPDMVGNLLRQFPLSREIYLGRKQIFLSSFRQHRLIHLGLQRLPDGRSLPLHKTLHILQPFNLLVNFRLLLIHQRQKMLRRPRLHIFPDLAKRHPQLLQRPYHLKCIHLPHKIIPVMILLILHRR